MKQAVPNTVVSLIERYVTNRDAYRRAEYNETQTRREFIDPLFKALGWDVDNEQSKSEQWKEVIHEEAIKVGGVTKAPDYSFRLGGKPLFFLEAKKPSVNIKDDPAPALQLRRYAWSAKLSLSILTNFEHFIVYDTRIGPTTLSDKPTLGRILLISYEEYSDRWHEIAAIFSPESIYKGAFEKYIESATQKRGANTVDNAFLAEIEDWRELLARNIALRNPGLKPRELNFAVQGTIDRIIFLRICEDRGVEPYGRLMALNNGVNVYARLRELFYRADERYNSGLFHFKKEKDQLGAPDELTPRLTIDDKVLKDIFKRLYYPDCPYEFSVLPVEILGQVYERFLGSVIRLTEGGHAKVEPKPEVRKAGGVFYTPTYIVEYIVKNTVGKLLADQTPQAVAGVTENWLAAKDRRPLAILDPACGSGSFLLGAYQFLLDWHLELYAKNLDKWSKGKKPKLYRDHHGNWHLTTDERKRILTANIYGVDIDPQAVEVTKLSLLLKVLEGESAETLRQLELFHERVLPDLANNIKCGNSLIGPDFYKHRQMEIFDEAETYRVNAFDWKAEFPAIMSSSGFDSIIGNPPYVRQESLADYKGYFERCYEAYDGMADLYTYFMEKSVKLLHDGGLFSIIVSSSFLRATYGKALRRTLKKHAAIIRIVDFGGLAIFANAKDTYVSIPLLQKGGTQARVEVAKVDRRDFTNLDDHVSQLRFTISSERLSEEAWALKSDEETAVHTKIMKAGKPLGEYLSGRIFYGIKTGLNDAFIIDDATRQQLIMQDKNSGELIKPLLRGEDICRFIFHETGLWLIFTRRGVDIDHYPAICEHLARWKETLTPKRNKNTKKGRKPGRYAWYEIQDDVAYHEVFDGPKLIYPDIAKGPRFCLDTCGHYLANTAYCLGTDDRYLLGILNSRLFWFAISNISIPFGVRAGQYRYRLIYQYMEKVPIRVIDQTNCTDRGNHDNIVSLVERMLDLHKRFPAANADHDRTLIERQIAATDCEIDQLIYELYGLTAEEIAIVEETTSRS